MFAHIIIIFVLIILMLYSFRILKSYLIIIIVYSFSLIIGMESLTHPHTPFSPMFEIFFLIFQSGILILSSLKLYETKKGKQDV